MASPNSRRSALRAVMAAAVLTLSACGLPAPMLQDVGGASESGSDADLEAYYSQEVEWEECGQSFECAAVTVPIDYDSPNSGTIDIAIKKYGLPSAEGMVLINPGGPGGSGIQTVELAAQLFTSTLREAREIVGFDPRGVGASAPITCYDGEQLDELYTTLYDVETDEGWEQFIDSVTEYATACEQKNPDTIGHVDTVSAARDMDVIRSALGIDLLDYLGFSYGTKLGATYADLFGHNVGRFVLDGAMDLSLTDKELVRGQLHGFERAYRVYLEDCMAGPNCPFSGTVDDAYDDTVLLLEELAERPLDSEDPERPTTDADLMNTIIISLYSTENWGFLSAAVSDLYAGDGALTKRLSDFALEREEDGTYAPGDGAMLAINCLDLPEEGELDRDRLRTEAAQYEEISPLFGAALGYSEIGCATFPIKTDSGPRAIAAPDAPTMVVIGTTGDPATPYEWSEAMAGQLDDSVHLTWEGEGHTAYGKGSCIDEAVDRFFIDGLLPEDGLRC